LLAQQAPETPADDNAEVVTLDEFQVSAGSLKDSYIASETTSGTRLSEKVIDLPYSVEVFTEKLVEDFQLFDSNELMTFVGGASGDTGGEVRVRGFKVLITRDGFQFAMPSTPSNTLQTEVIKGPLSILYGRSSPGGIINKVSRRPKFKPEYMLSLSAGTEGFYRAAVTGTGPIAKLSLNNKLFYFAYAEYQRKELFQDYVKSESFYYGLGLLYRFRPTTSLTATFEYQPVRATELGNSMGLVAYSDSWAKATPV
jgi:outer membrane receptor for ferric coprogen and ferric-rhodotorulic acid